MSLASYFIFQNCQTSSSLIFKGSWIDQVRNHLKMTVSTGIIVWGQSQSRSDIWSLHPRWHLHFCFPAVTWRKKWQVHTESPETRVVVPTLACVFEQINFYFTCFLPGRKIVASTSASSPLEWGKQMTLQWLERLDIIHAKWLAQCLASSRHFINGGCKIKTQEIPV